VPLPRLGSVWQFDVLAQVDYSTLEHAGEPHRGRITEAEKQIVREHLDEVNRRLSEQDIRMIDPADPGHAEALRPVRDGCLSDARPLRPAPAGPDGEGSGPAVAGPALVTAADGLGRAVLAPARRS
jgi:hypothetical protein